MESVSGFHPRGNHGDRRCCGQHGRCNDWQNSLDREIQGRNRKLETRVDAHTREGHDRSQYEIYAYDFSLEDGTPHRQRLKKAIDNIRFVHALSDGPVPFHYPAPSAAQDYDGRSP